jgi:hypothetical protein
MTPHKRPWSECWLVRQAGAGGRIKKLPPPSESVSTDNQKPQRIYELPKRRLSPNVTQENRGAQAKDKDNNSVAETAGLSLRF